MKQLFLYVYYYRISKAYRDVFGIEDAPGYLMIQSCYSYGLLVLMALCAYTLALETIVLWKLGIKTSNWLIIATFLPFGLFYFFAEHFLGDLKNRFKILEKKYNKENYRFFERSISVYICCSVFCVLFCLIVFL